MSRQAEILTQIRRQQDKIYDELEKIQVAAKNAKETVLLGQQVQRNNLIGNINTANQSEEDNTEIRRAKTTQLGTLDGLIADLVAANRIGNPRARQTALDNITTPFYLNGGYYDTYILNQHHDPRAGGHLPDETALLTFLQGAHRTAVDHDRHAADAAITDARTLRTNSENALAPLNIALATFDTTIAETQTYWNRIQAEDQAIALLTHANFNANILGHQAATTATAVIASAPYAHILPEVTELHQLQKNLKPDNESNPESNDAFVKLQELEKYGHRKNYSASNAGGGILPVNQQDFEEYCKKVKDEDGYKIKSAGKYTYIAPNAANNTPAKITGNAESFNGYDQDETFAYGFAYEAKILEWKKVNLHDNPDDDITYEMIKGFFSEGIAVVKFPKGASATWKDLHQRLNTINANREKNPQNTVLNPNYPSAFTEVLQDIFKERPKRPKVYEELATAMLSVLDGDQLAKISIDLFNAAIGPRPAPGVPAAPHVADPGTVELKDSFVKKVVETWKSQGLNKEELCHHFFKLDYRAQVEVFAKLTVKQQTAIVKSNNFTDTSITTETEQDKMLLKLLQDIFNADRRVLLSAPKWLINSPSERLAAAAKPVFEALTAQTFRRFYNNLSAIPPLTKADTQALVYDHIRNDNGVGVARPAAGAPTALRA